MDFVKTGYLKHLSSYILYFKKKILFLKNLNSLTGFLCERALLICVHGKLLPPFPSHPLFCLIRL